MKTSEAFWMFLPQGLGELFEMVRSLFVGKDEKREQTLGSAPITNDDGRSIYDYQPVWFAPVGVPASMQ